MAWVFCFSLLAGCAVGALLLGQDSNTDLYRYHLYNGYAFVNGRLDEDLVPAALATFLNPVLDAVHYLGIVYLPPRVVGGLLGAIQGLNAIVVFLLARRLVPDDRGGTLVAAVVGVIAATGPTARSLLGTTIGDTLASLPALAALLLALRTTQEDSERARSALRLLGAGFLSGAAAGLKLTMLTSVLALGILLAWRAARRELSFAAVLAAGVGAAAGYAAVAGYWSWQLWQRYGNPILPFANQLFRSPYVPAVGLRDERWAAQSLLDLLAPPFAMAVGATSRLQEIPFRDTRLLLLVVAAAVWLALRVAGRRPALPRAARDLLAYLLIGYVLWALAFYYYRYAVVLEYLAPLGLAILIQAALARVARPTLVAAAVFVLATSSVGSWGRLSWGERWFHIRLPPHAHEADSLVLLDSSLSSFLIPFFPPQTRFAGLEGVGSQRFEDLLSARIAAHRGPLMWLVYRGRPRESSGPERFGLRVTDDCGVVRTGEGRWALCRLERTTAAGGKP